MIVVKNWPQGLQPQPFYIKPLCLKDIAGNYSNTPVEPRKYSTRQLINYLCENYNPKIGKIVFLHGPPGTGKSYFISSLMTEWTRGKHPYTPFIVDSARAFFASSVPYTMTTQNNKRCMFIFEDSGGLLDEQNRPRLGEFPLLLNITEGLLSQGHEHLFLFTFNDALSTIDNALLRPGRLFADVLFDNLTEQEAIAWIKQNIKDHNKDIIKSFLERSYQPKTERYNLSLLYGCMHGMTAIHKSIKKSTKKIGF